MAECSRVRSCRREGEKNECAGGRTTETWTTTPLSLGHQLLLATHADVKMEAWWDKFFETQQMVDAKRREDLLAAFEAATVTFVFVPAPI